LAGNILTVPAVRVVAGANFICTFTNTANPNLSISKSAPSPGLVVNVNSAYALTVTNSGPGGAATARVVDVLPAGVSFVSATGTNWTCGNASGTITCNFSGGTIAASGGTSAITVTVNPTASTATTNVTNYASIDPTGGTSAPAPGSGCLPAAACASNTAPVVASADLVVTKSNGVTGVTKGSTITYTITATNNGPNSITGAIVSDTPVSNITCPPANPVTVSSGGAYTVANLVGAGITLGTLTNGQSVTLSYSCTVN
jgi:uncharacterized repeat protein (TIGR01451 family)